MKEQHDLAKWMDGKMTGSELEAFENSAEFRTYNKIKSHSEKLSAPHFDTEKMYHQVMQQPKEKAPIKLKPNWYLRIAAIIVLALGLFFLARPMITVTETAQNGEKKTFTLPDDSEVTLNSGSHISYKKYNWDSKRTLELDGEAYFKVSKGGTFDVITKHGTVTVVGTQFNVKQRNSKLEVACYEGKVWVQDQPFSVFLTPGQSVIYENKIGVSLGVSESSPLWMNNRISFRSESLATIISEMERQYNISIATKNIQTNQEFTGTIPSDNIDTALQIISTAYNFKYNKSGKNKITFIGK